MPTISEPRQEAQSWTYAWCREAFMKREIGEVTFIVSLQLIGFSPKDAETEVNLARMERHTSTDSLSPHNKFNPQREYPRNYSEKSGAS